MSSQYNFFYAVGTVLAGFAFVMPAFVAAVIWNRVASERAVNPWTPPLLWGVLLLSLGILGSTDQSRAFGENWVVGLGLFASVLWCGLRRQRYGRSKSGLAKL